MKLSLSGFLLPLGAATALATNANPPALIPQAQEIKVFPGSFHRTVETEIFCAGAGAESAAGGLNAVMTPAIIGCHIPPRPNRLNPGHRHCRLADLKPI